MVWAKTNPTLLLTILVGVCCDGMFKPKCSNEFCRCGETVTITCTLTHPVNEIVLKDSNKTLLNSTLLTKGKMCTNDEKINIKWTEDKVTVIISKVKFSDILKYDLILVAKESPGYEITPMLIDVSGLCKPDISKSSETKELECEVESENNASIVWIDNHRRIFQATRTKEPKQLNSGFKLWSSLKLTEEINENLICCSVSCSISGLYEESCVPNTSALKMQSSSKSPTVTVFFILLPVAFVIAALGYLLKRKSIINREALV